MATPSKVRREGREAFDPNCTQVDLNPYPIGHYHYKDFVDGWQEQQRKYEKEQESMEEFDSEFSDWSIIEAHTTAFYRDNQLDIGVALMVGDDEYAVEIILSLDELKATVAKLEAEREDLLYGIEGCYGEED